VREAEERAEANAGMRGVEKEEGSRRAGKGRGGKGAQKMARRPTRDGGWNLGASE